MLSTYPVFFIFVWVRFFQQLSVAISLVGLEEETLRGIFWVLGQIVDGAGAPEGVRRRGHIHDSLSRRTRQRY